MTEARDVLRYLAEVRSALRGLPARERDEAIAELEANLLADIERRGGNPAAVQAAIADLGAPEAYAAAVAETYDVDVASPQPQGRILGMPYEFRAPTATSIMERMWNPGDPRILMPRTFGVGWTINFGAVAVRLGLARPDDTEERPFENLSNRAVSIAMAVPAVFGVVTAVIAAAYWSRLPESVPTHFNAAGVADGWGTKSLALGIPVAIACLLPLVVFGWQLLRGASRGTLAISSTMLAFAGGLSAVVVAYTVANAVYGVEGWWIGPVFLGSLLVPGLMFYLLARTSIKKEWSAAGAARNGEKESQ